jgi:hypothetical protein
VNDISRNDISSRRSKLDTYFVDVKVMGRSLLFELLIFSKEDDVMNEIFINLKETQLEPEKDRGTTA